MPTRARVIKIIPLALDYFIYFPRLSMRSGNAAWKAKNLLHTDKKYNPIVGHLKNVEIGPKMPFFAQKTWDSIAVSAFFYHLPLCYRGFLSFGADDGIRKNMPPSRVSGWGLRLGGIAICVVWVLSELLYAEALGGY